MMIGNAGGGRMVAASLLILVMFPALLTAEPGAALRDKYNASPASREDVVVFDAGSIPRYADFSKSYPAEFSEEPGAVVELTGHNLAAGSSEDSFLDWERGRDFFEWTFTIADAGYYKIDIEYLIEGGSGASAQREMSINGEFPFEEIGNIFFHRRWVEAGLVRQNTIGDDVSPRQIQQPLWQTVTVRDGFGYYPEPLHFYFSEGEHTIGMRYIAEPMKIRRIILRSAENIPSYSEVKKEYDRKGYLPVKQHFTLQAEDTSWKTDPTLRRIAIQDPAAVPYENGYRRLNGIGSGRWRRGGQTIAWNLDVPETGLYAIGLKVGQWWGEGLPSHRRIEINGAVPFKEFGDYVFVYNREFRNEILSSPEGEPYLVYLTEGRHTLSMSVQVGRLQEISKDLKANALLLSSMLRKIVMITGQEPDVNFSYELDKNIPGLMDDMASLKESMDKQIDLLVSMSDRRPVAANNFAMLSDLFAELIADPDSIPRKMNDLENAQKNIGTWMTDLLSQPLTIDYFMIGDPGMDMPRARSNFFQRLFASVSNFFRSFVKDYDNVGGLVEAGSADRSIDVWIARGKEWAELTKELADETFTKDTGIAINLNVLPPSQLNAGQVNALLLAILSGNAPDVALGTNSQSPVEFAVRGAAYDLRTFPDYEETVQNFLPGVMTPYHFNGGTYGLPETMDFTVLIYRNDIFAELGLSVPDTWEDVYKNMLPILRENGMDFSYPRGAAAFLPFLYQMNGTFYKDMGRKSGLDSPEAFQAFKTWTELYTNYKVPVQADFYNRMRTGTMPIGVGNYYTYILLSTAAPELKGRWDIAPMPGIRNAEGEVERWAGGMSTASIILNQSSKKEDSWEFMKWWSSEPVQAQFGREVEALMGVEARWNTANVKAFKALPWEPEHISVIDHQWDYYREQPYVLGGYFTMRHVDNAWNRVVMGTMGVRDSLEKAVKDINRELKVKQEEFNYIPTEFLEEIE
ncbi:MAG: extracellular solute-binding protein [Spirochaetales bacterium]|nr:extracellular solute-binding protein [Spirochaetales bacterium]